MIYKNMTNDEYHATDAISKTGLWTIQTKSPFHYIGSDKYESDAQRFGTAIHTAVLEPHAFENDFMRAAENRRGNQWKDLLNTAELNNQTALTFDEYDDALRIRDALHKNPLIQKITAGDTAIEHSAFWNDPETGVQCRCRPDLYNPKLKIIADLKSTRDARPYKFASSVAEYGYHMQESFYRDGWAAAQGGDVDAFIFIAVEGKAPFAHVIYELDDESLTIGRLLARQALNKYAECKKTDTWPSYFDNVQTLKLSDWGRKMNVDEEDE